MNKNDSNRIYQIDLFRFLAALSVVLFHYLFRGYASKNLSTLNFSEVGDFFKYGHLGVELFFIISGFVISLSIKEKSLTQFVISRISRLYPIYWICALLTFITITLFGAPRFTAQLSDFFLNLTMFQNYLRIKNIDGVYWTLFIEMKFYIFIIGTYLILNKIKEFKIDYLIYSWTFLSVLYIFVGSFSFAKAINSILTLNWASYFIAGMVFYQIYKNKLAPRYIVLLLISLAVSLYHAISKIDALESEYNTPFSPSIIATIITLFYLIMFLVSNNKLKSINSPKLIKLGMLTYPLYLLHHNIGFIAFNNLDGYTNKYIIVTTTIIIMLFLSFILSRSYEPKVSGFLKKKLQILAKKINSTRPRNKTY